MSTDLASRRQHLVERIRASTDLRDPRILRAFAEVPRHEFLSEAQGDVLTKTAPFRSMRDRP